MMETALLWGKQSYCKRNKVGAVLAKNNRVLVTGYNGTLVGHDNCCEQDDQTFDSVVHAEQNIICFAARYGIQTDNTSLYVTLSPCVMCAKLIVQAGIKHVYYVIEYRDSQGLELLRNANIHVQKITGGFTHDS